jgi:hypothetical protein
MFCVVTGDSGHVAVVSRGRVTYSLLDPHRGLIWGVSCPTVRFCMAVGDAGAWVWDGSRWSRTVHVPMEPNGFQTVSCTSARFCALGDQDGGISTLLGRAWHYYPLVTLNGSSSSELDTIGQMSCVSAHYCLAVSLAAGRWLTFDGSSWTVHGSFEGPQDTGYTPTMLTCPSQGDCVAASTNDVLYELTGASWHRLGYLLRQSVLSRLIESIAPTPAVSVSCPTRFACVAVDGGGNAYVGHPFTGIDRADASSQEGFHS